MASVDQVQSFLAYWFQLGKPVLLQRENTLCLPSPVFQGAELSPAFQACWQRIMAEPKQSFLSGTDDSIATLLSDQYDIEDCARCNMPTPMPVRGIASPTCPCTDLPSWPNDEIPQPREAVSTQTHLDDIRQRLIGRRAYHNMASHDDHSPTAGA